MASISEASSRSLADVEDIVEEEEEEDEVEDVIDGDRQSSQPQLPAAVATGEGEVAQVAAAAPPEAAAKLPFVEMAGRRWTDGGYSYGFDSRTRRWDDVTAGVRIYEPPSSLILFLSYLATQSVWSI